jgi:phosphate-selective porin OprO and OprP
MKIRNVKYAVAAITLGGLVAYPAAVRADDTAAEIHLLKERLKQLEAKIAKQAAEQKQTEAQVQGIAKSPAMPPPPETPIVCKDQPCPPPPPPVFVSFTNGLKVESWDKAFSFKIGGRIFVDGGINSEPVEAFPQPFPPFPAFLAPFFPAHPASGYGNNVRFRQARLEVEGRAWTEWLYKLQYDFTGAPNDLIAGGFRDAWFAWQPEFLQPIAPVTIQIGHQFEASGMERAASSKYRDFIERALPSDLMAGNRHIGLAVETGGDNVWGFYGKPTWSFKSGIYSTSFEDGNPLGATVSAAPNITTGGIPAGNSGFLNPVPGGHQYWDAAARLTYAPIHTEDMLLHIGGSVRYQKPNDATATSDDRVLQPGFTLAEEANAVGSTLLGTQALTCVVATAQLPGQNCVKDMVNPAADLLAAYGPFSVQAEYFAMHYDRNAALLALFNSFGNHAPGGTSINFNGFYVYATWYLTGESRSEQYRSYEEFNAPGNGNVAQIKILHPVSAGGWGAWELAARVSEINLNDGSTGFFQPLGIAGLGVRQNIQGGRESDFTLGLNWYPDKGIRFMANWVNVFQYSANFNRPDLNGIHPQLFELRAQVDW